MEIPSSLKNDIVPRVNNLSCFHVKNPQDVLHYGMGEIANSYERLICYFHILKNTLACPHILHKLLFSNAPGTMHIPRNP